MADSEGVAAERAEAAECYEAVKTADDGHREP